jgi:hypothetical protein
VLRCQVKKRLVWPYETRPFNFYRAGSTSEPGPNPSPACVFVANSPRQTFCPSRKDTMRARLPPGGGEWSFFGGADPSPVASVVARPLTVSVRV